MTINSILEEIINLSKKYSASTVILFGSRAKGTATERSDIDIAVSGIIGGYKKIWTRNLQKDLNPLKIHWHLFQKLITNHIFSGGLISCTIHSHNKNLNLTLTDTTAKMTA